MRVREGVVVLKDIASTEKQIKRTKLYRNVRRSLIDQLERSGNDTPHFLDLVEDYMKNWIVKELAYRDIQERGTSVDYRNSETQYGTKKNDNVDILLKAEQQMIKILEMLNIKPDMGVDADEEL
jgi:phage terminase small subunit